MHTQVIQTAWPVTIVALAWLAFASPLFERNVDAPGFVRERDRGLRVYNSHETEVYLRPVFSGATQTTSMTEFGGCLENSTMTGFVMLRDTTEAVIPCGRDDTINVFDIMPASFAYSARYSLFCTDLELCERFADDGVWYDVSSGGSAHMQIEGGTVEFATQCNASTIGPDLTSKPLLVARKAVDISDWNLTLGEAGVLRLCPHSGIDLLWHIHGATVRVALSDRVSSSFSGWEIVIIILLLLCLLLRLAQDEAHTAFLATGTIQPVVHGLSRIFVAFLLIGACIASALLENDRRMSQMNVFMPEEVLAVARFGGLTIKWISIAVTLCTAFALAGTRALGDDSRVLVGAFAVSSNVVGALTAGRLLQGTHTSFTNVLLLVLVGMFLVFSLVYWLMRFFCMHCERWPVGLLALGWSVVIVAFSVLLFFSPIVLHIDALLLVWPLALFALCVIVTVSGLVYCLFAKFGSILPIL